MLKFIKWITGMAMLPLAAALTLVFLDELPVDGRLTELSRTSYWFIGGFAAWLLLYAIFPRPVRTYVLGHELTHALWGMLMGARVSRLRVSNRGGSVNLSKSNVLITLAPYFFPFYSVLALVIFLLVEFFGDTGAYLPFWYGLFGLTWSFHLTFTVTMLATHQPDIQEHGRVFSYVFIYCINLATAAVLLHVLTAQPLRDLANGAWQQTHAVYLATWSGLMTAMRHGSELVSEKMQ